MTIPRLELLAAAIGSRQTNEIVKALGYENIPVFYWSDSTTVLAWLNRDCQWGIFVWNRVREIRGLTRPVRGNTYPANSTQPILRRAAVKRNSCLARSGGKAPAGFARQNEWPSLAGSIDEREVSAELKKTAFITMLDVKEVTSFDIIEKFSSYSKMIRFFAIMIRFKNFKLRVSKNKGNRITYQEIREAESKFLKYLQGEMFMRKNDPTLISLQTFEHTGRLIRLKTKIIERNDYFSFLCPILLSPKHRVVELIIREKHENMCHAGVQTVICQLREKF